MEKLIVKNFGPIKDIELGVNDFLVLIGPNASGKSLIARLVYFFRLIKYDLNIDKIREIFGDSFYNFETDSYVEYVYENDASVVVKSNVHGDVAVEINHSSVKPSDVKRESFFVRPCRACQSNFLFINRQKTDLDLDKDFVETLSAMVKIVEKTLIKANVTPELFLFSSGQRFIIFILNKVSTMITHRILCHTVIEKPESSLFPELQKELTELIVLLANQKNKVVITTHSPYVLSALNNLLYAHTLGQFKPDEVGQIIDPRIWLDHNRVGAYFVSDGGIKNILDEDEYVWLIHTEILDSVSETINEVYNNLFDLDDL